MGKATFATKKSKNHIGGGGSPESPNLAKILKKIKNDELPDYINDNLNKYKDWLD